MKVKGNEVLKFRLTCWEHIELAHVHREKATAAHTFNGKSLQQQWTISENAPLNPAGTDRLLSPRLDECVTEQ